ncbi:hypothetical protein CDL15_Pgr021802 [Punica granatum]|uniref:Methyltransferase n=1 Tax=Punica granatum TaxID=22663 RepID=A0A218WS10_PUNGR|nr:hypothetical protein CDL15_Pgr021802 [Punica granatum]
MSCHIVSEGVGSWYTNLATCLTPLPEVSGAGEIAGGKLPKWPERLNAVPPRISQGTIDDIMLEMDSILRPEGSVIIRDGVDVLVKVKSIIDWMNYDSQIINHEDGPLVREKLLFAVKSCWTAPAPLDFIHHVSTNSNLAHAS